MLAGVMLTVSLTHTNTDTVGAAGCGRLRRPVPRPTAAAGVRAGPSGLPHWQCCSVTLWHPAAAQWAARMPAAAGAGVSRGATEVHKPI
jgi:hypothetical protein